jgi:tRNA(Ile)-lysidine synthase
MLTKLSSFIREHDMLQPGDQIICAVSGGADSMALLFALYLIREKFDIRLSAAHFNHKLRGSESDEDESFVREFCQRYDIPLFIGCAHVQTGEKGLEAAARDARYAFFRTLPGKIATAHTADDNAETVLLHLVRGTGLKGLGGIAPVRESIIRPMLTVTRQEVLAFLAEYHLPHREDSSNEGDEFLRNRLRHHVMPLLREENPSIGENLSAMALRLRQDELALQAFSQYEQPLRIQPLREQAPAIRSRVLEAFLKDNGVKEPEARHIQQAEALVFSQNPSAYARFPGGVVLRRQYDILTAQTVPQKVEAVTLPCPGSVELNGYRIICAPAEQIINTANVFTVDCRGPITIRCRQSGDSIRLSGGTKSLKKLLIDRKIPATQRDAIPVAADEGGILGVFGIGVHLDRTAKKLPAWQIIITNNSEPLL